jgi:uncharacterized protein involved in exopolysaccharide biosynthesis
VGHYIEGNDLLPVLYEDRWNPGDKSYRTRFWQKMPTLWRAVTMFTERVRRVDNDSKSGLITLTVEWRRPELAAKWANDLIALVNAELRDRTIAESERNIAYLDQQLQKANDVELRSSIYKLMEQQIKTGMMARGSIEFAFRVVDPAVSPQEPVRPRPAIMSSVAGLLGLLAGTFFILRYAYLKQRDI